MKTGREGILTRKVTPLECSWLSKDYDVGTKVKEYLDHTYGCIGYGTAVILEDEECFHEIPSNAILWFR